MFFINFLHFALKKVGCLKIDKSPEHPSIRRSQIRMKKFASLALALSFAAICVSGESEARLFEDKCNPTPKCGECYDCAPNKPMKLVELEPCAYKDKPYNYYTWKKVGEKEVRSDMYNWAESPATPIGGS